MLLTTRRQVCSLAAALPVSAFASSVQASEANAGAEKSPKAELSVLLYPGFETIDAMGPVEMFGNLRDFSMRFASLEGRVVKSAQGLPVMTEKFEMENASPLLLVPGAAPAFLPKDPRFFEMLKSAAQKADYVLTVCTGSLLVAKTGLLNGKKATSNKKALPMVMKAVPQVDWQKKARWVVDGRFYTSSGISAGMDMALGFIADRFGEAEARRIAGFTEYRRIADPSDDPFAIKKSLKPEKRGAFPVCESASFSREAGMNGRRLRSVACGRSRHQGLKEIERLGPLVREHFRVPLHREHEALRRIVEGFNNAVLR